MAGYGGGSFAPSYSQIVVILGIFFRVDDFSIGMESISFLYSSFKVFGIYHIRDILVSVFLIFKLWISKFCFW